MIGDPIRSQPKPVRAEKEPKRLRQVSAKRAARIAAGEHPIKRGWMKKQPPRRIERDAPEAGYTHWLHAQPCRAIGVIRGHVCKLPIQAAHLRNHTGLSRKEPAHLQTSLCDGIHDEYDERRGYFECWDDVRRVEWFLARVAESRLAWMDLSQEERNRWLAAAQRWAGRSA